MRRDHHNGHRKLRPTTRRFGLLRRQGDAGVDPLALARRVLRPHPHLVGPTRLQVLEADLRLLRPGRLGPALAAALGLDVHDVAAHLAAAFGRGSLPAYDQLRAVLRERQGCDRSGRRLPIIELGVCVLGHRYVEGVADPVAVGILGRDRDGRGSLGHPAER